MDAQTGIWLNAFLTPGIQPVSLIAEPDGVIVTGPGTLAAKFAANGTPGWASPAPANIQSWAHIAASPDPTDPNIYVLCQENTPKAEENVLLRQLNRGSGVSNWSIRMGGPSIDTAGALGVGPDGDVRVCYSSDDRAPSFAGQPIPGVPSGSDAVGAEYAIAARVRPDGGLVWTTPLGIPVGGASMLAHDLDVDPAGNTWIGVKMNRAWQIGGVPVSPVDKMIALISVDGAGIVHDFSHTRQHDRKDGHGVSAPARTLVISAGEYEHTVRFPPLGALPDRGNNRGVYVAIARPAPGQEMLILRPSGQMTLDELAASLEAQGLTVYAEVGIEGSAPAIAAYATSEQIAALQADPTLTFEEEVLMSPNGVTNDAGWGLARVNNGGTQTPPQAAQPYYFPETSSTVVLYLVDTAVANDSAWFDANPNLVIEEQVLIRGAGDPTESSQFEHGTRMLSLVAGPETGAALGTSVRLINYDIYPNGGTTTSALLVKAVFEAIQHRRADTSGDPGVLCLAVSSEAGATSPSLRAAIDLAVAEGLTVIVSAGNQGGDVMQHIPASYGIDPGIVCAGASNKQNSRLAMSNDGPAIDLFAPGDAVRTICLTHPAPRCYEEMTGTSPAAALTAAAALVALGGQPAMAPATVETTLVADAYPATVALIQIGTVINDFDSWSDFYGINPPNPSGDSDGDGTTDLLEYFHGGNPLSDDAKGNRISLTSYQGTMEVTFPIDATLYDPESPNALVDGTPWRVQVSTDLKNWAAPNIAAQNAGQQVGNRIPITWWIPADSPQWFVRVEVGYEE